MKKEIKIFFTALMFYTRIPCPSWVDHSPDYLEKSTRYFPLIGLIVGGLSALTYYLVQLIFSQSVAILFSMACSILLTGAFHEDGLADVCDGFGGGWTKEKILNIMKDSRIGTYGLVGLLLVLLSKFFLSVELAELSVSYFVFALVLAHVLSRYNATNVILLFSYSREDATSKTKPLAKHMTFSNYLILLVFSLIPAVYGAYHFHWGILMLYIPLLLLAVFMGRYFRKWIGGFTGDCLGAVQQISEIAIYLVLLFLWRFI